MSERNAYMIDGDDVWYAYCSSEICSCYCGSWCAMLGAKTASTNKDGESEKLWSIMQRMSKLETVRKPGNDEGEKNLLSVKYQVFLELCSIQRIYRKYIDRLVVGAIVIMVKLLGSGIARGIDVYILY